MGILLRDSYVHTNLCQLNLRFGPDQLEEMVGLQREFRIFSAEHSLEQAFSLLNIGPQQEPEQRTNWRLYLSRDLAQTFFSDDPAHRTAHDRIVAVLQENLESDHPLPVHFTCHDASGPNPRVLVTRDNTPLAFSRRRYLTISLPTIPAT